MQSRPVALCHMEMIGSVPRPGSIESEAIQFGILNDYGTRPSPIGNLHPYSMYSSIGRIATSRGGVVLKTPNPCSKLGPVCGSDPFPPVLLTKTTALKCFFYVLLLVEF